MRDSSRSSDCAHGRGRAFALADLDDRFRSPGSGFMSSPFSRRRSFRRQVRSAPAQGMERARSPADPDAARQADNSPNRCRPTPGVTSPGGAKASQNSAFPVRQPARAAGASRLLALAALSGRMTACRMAAGRKRSDQILAFDLAGRCRHRDARRNRKMRWRIERDHQELKPGTRPRSL